MTQTNRKEGTLMYFLLTNEVFNFYSSDWSKHLVVDWSIRAPLNTFRKDIVKVLGKDFQYGRAVSYDKIDYTVKEADKS